MTVKKKVEELKNTKDLDLAISRLSDKSYRVRMAAYEAINDMHESIATDDLLAAYPKETRESVRCKAIMAIGECSNEPRMEIFRPILEDPGTSDNLLEATYIAMLHKSMQEIIVETLHDDERRARIAQQLLDEMVANNC